MLGDDELSSLIGLIYAASLDASLWPDVLNRVTDALAGSFGNLSVYDLTTHALSSVAPRTDPDWAKEYRDRWVDQNFLWRRSVAHPVGETWGFETFVARDDFERTPFYQEWWRPQRLEIALGTNVLHEGTASGVLSVYRPRERGMFGPAEQRLLALLAPHLQRSVQLGLRLARAEMERASSAEMLNRLSQGALLVGADGRVLFANRAASAVLADGAGLRLDRGGRLTARRVADTAALRRLLAGASSGAGGRMLLPRPERLSLMLLVVPLTVEVGWLPPERPAAIVFVKDPEREGLPAAQDIQEQFGLTPAQAAVALQVVQGIGVTDAARRLGVARSTARAHLHQVFAKTGTRRQSELTQLLSRYTPC